MFEGTLAQIALGIQSGCSKHEARNQQPSSQTRTGCKARGFSGRQTSPTSPKPESAIALSPKSSFMLLHITFSPKRFKRPYSAFSFATWLTSGFGGSFGSLAPYLIGILIIPGSLAPPISMLCWSQPLIFQLRQEPLLRISHMHLGWNSGCISCLHLRVQRVQST